jgi:hypothetical protein
MEKQTECKKNAKDFYIGTRIDAGVTYLCGEIRVQVI